MSAPTWTLTLTPYRVVLLLLIALALYAGSRRGGDYDFVTPLVALAAWALVVLWLIAGWLL